MITSMDIKEIATFDNEHGHIGNLNKLNFSMDLMEAENHYQSCPEPKGRLSGINDYLGKQ